MLLKIGKYKGIKEEGKRLIIGIACMNETGFGVSEVIETYGFFADSISQDMKNVMLNTKRDSPICLDLRVSGSAHNGKMYMNYNLNDLIVGEPAQKIYEISSNKNYRQLKAV